MGRKVWLWIIAGLAILVALAVTAAIAFKTIWNSDLMPTEPETSEAQEATDGAPTQEATADAAEREEIPADATEEAATQQMTQEETAESTGEAPEETQEDTTEPTEFDPSSIPDPSHPNMTPLG